MKPPAQPRFHRQRFLLAFLQAAGGSLSKMDFQKLLFLAHCKKTASYYDFVPYKFGCYSFQAQSDIEVLASLGWLHVDDRRIRLTNHPKHILNESETTELNRFMEEFSKIRGRQLVKYVYEHYPYYATRSQMATDVMDKESYQRIREVKAQIQSNDPALFTIGYEGITFENYVNKLIKNNVKLLCDVRRNPISRKFGFSKGIMSRLLPKLGIQYSHIGELGIPTEMRAKLETKEDYNRLFDAYTQALPCQELNLQKILNLMREYSRIALMCFETQPSHCHRHCISAYLRAKHAIRIVHL